MHAILCQPRIHPYSLCELGKNRNIHILSCIEGVLWSYFYCAFIPSKRFFGAAPFNIFLLAYAHKIRTVDYNVSCWIGIICSFIYYEFIKLKLNGENYKKEMNASVHMRVYDKSVCVYEPEQRGIAF